MRLKILNIALLLIITCSQLVTGQNKIVVHNPASAVKTQETDAPEKVSHPIDVKPFLEKFYKANGIDISKIQINNNALHKANWNFQENVTQVSWWSANFVTNKYYQVESTCRKVGEHCYIFVANSIWNSSVNQAGVDSVATAFDSRTPLGSINSHQGIYQNDVDVFGNPPDVDGDPKIIILILDIQDSYSSPGDGYVAGYFSPVNELTSPSDTYYSVSNHAEFYYLDGVQNNLTGNSGIQDAMSTTAHEFQHMIHYNYIKGATDFFNECFSVTAEIINGYPIYSQGRFANEPDHYLIDWRDTNDPNVLTDYSRAARFGLYLLEQFGTDLFTTYLKRAVDGVKGINQALQAIGVLKQWDDIIPDWVTANYLNNKSVKPEWGYTYPNLPQEIDTKYANPNVTGNNSVHNFAADYISFISGSNLTVNFNNNNDSHLKVRAIKYGAAKPVVEDVTTNADYNVPDFGTTYNKVTFIVYYDDSNPLTGGGPFNYSYTATGTYENLPQEILHDDNTDPVAVWTGNVGDTTAVLFDGMSGFQLDSIKVALRQAGTMHGGVYQYGGSFSNPLGKHLAVPLSITSNISERPGVPYPIPWPNWVKVDLSSYNIDASYAFAVAIFIEGVYQSDGSGANGLMFTLRSGTDYYYSETYTNNPSTGSPRWLYYTTTDNQTYIYLIRAYVSNTTTGVKETVELLPTAYSLDQNYPNPFNPSTIISYSIPKANNVQIKIFDSLGKEVRSLINEEKAAGKYNIAWDGRDNSGRRVSSGIYFYTINAGDFFESKKMVLMK